MRRSAFILIALLLLPAAALCWLATPWGQSARPAQSNSAPAKAAALMSQGGSATGMASEGEEAEPQIAPAQSEEAGSWPQWAPAEPAIIPKAVSAVPSAETPQGAISPAYDLQYFEDRLDASPRLAAAEAEHDAQERDARRIDHENGLKAVAGANAGRTADPLTATYNTASIYGGLSYPILGSRAREQAELNGAKARARSLKGRAELARREDLRELRRSYAQYWTAGRQVEAARAFLSAEPEVQRLLKRRGGLGMLRESKRLDLLTAFDAARSDLAAISAARDAALMTINRIAGTALQEFRPVPPALPAEEGDRNAVLQRVAEHPELEALRALLANRHDLLAYTSHRYPESDILLSLAGVNDSPGGVGGGGTLGVEFRAPIGVAGAWREGNAAARLSLIQYQRELEYRTQLLQTQAVEDCALVEAKRAGLALAQRRQAAAEQALREDFSRASMVPQESLEGLLQSRRDYYRASMDCLSAEMDGLSARVALLGLAGDPAPVAASRMERSNSASMIKLRLLGGELVAGIGRKNSSGGTRSKTEELFAVPSAVEAAMPPASARPEPEGMAVYMWATQDWLNRTRQLALSARGKRLPSSGDYDGDPMWRELARRKVRTVLLSLDGPQINELAADAQAFTHLVRLIGAAHEHGCRVELLLGEPAWILPPHRADLLKIVQELRSLPFDGLHLDLEPNQLKPADAEQQKVHGELVETLRAVKEVCPWELTLTVSPRYLDGPVGSDTFGGALEKAGVRRLALMIYFSDPDRIAATAGNLLKSHPGLHIAVAVSVESSAVVVPQITLAGLGRKKFYETAWALDDALRAYPNYAGLEVQDWASLKEMKP